MGLSYGEQSLCRVPPSPVHPHEGAPMLFYYNVFIFEAKSLICSLVGAFLWLSRGVASLWCQVCFPSSVVVNLHFSCPNSASVLSSCYSWYQFTWNFLQLEFSENHWFKAGVNVKAVFTSLNTAFLPISRSRFKRRQIPLHWFKHFFRTFCTITIQKPFRRNLSMRFGLWWKIKKREKKMCFFDHSFAHNFLFSILSPNPCLNCEKIWCSFELF